MKRSRDENADENNANNDTVATNNNNGVEGKKKKKKNKSKPIDREELSQQTKAGLNEIEELFSAAKKKKKENAIVKEKEEYETKLREEEELKKEKKNKKHQTEETEEYQGTYGVIKSQYNIPVTIISPEAPIHRWDAETGLPVYKAAALKVGEGGGTPLCPFDCNCCF